MSVVFGQERRSEQERNDDDAESTLLNLLTFTLEIEPIHQNVVTDGLGCR